MQDIRMVRIEYRAYRLAAEASLQEHASLDTKAPPVYRHSPAPGHSLLKPRTSLPPRRPIRKSKEFLA